ncbi:hypothetical protein OMP38_18715 [Cohnella ginsengisoli]|uniref:Uncharacterized protein n=1 Tax=Cohnella ginsengisoli TaxID=425004 RepID=A0A9X4QPF4_9BACL|nr:hypothetical protein [Cohnella ginsengisoli]MDG0792680.1 hypothetical protein [Cohnella ginsengisoli]
MRSDTVQGAKRGQRWFEGEKGLLLTGLLGFVLAAACGIWTLMNGGEVPPGGDVSKAFSFNAALGVFLLSTAAILPVSALGERSRAWFRRVYIGLALYAYGAETIQNFRGVNPRFVENGAALDQAVGNLFAFVALLLVLFYLYVGVQFFRARAYRLRPEVAIGIRYAMIAVTVSFAAGIWISVNQGRLTGADGNIIWLHGLGFHALQAVPLVAWLVERTNANARARRALVHIAGISYLLGLAAIGWRTIDGRSLMEWSPLPIAAGVCFLISLAAGASALRRAVRIADGRRQ